MGRGLGFGLGLRWREPALRSRPRGRLSASLSCSHRPPCPGCPRFAAPGIAPNAQSQLDALARAHGLPAVPVVCAAAETGFRLRARLSIRGHVGSPKLGLFELGTHRVVHIPNCRVQHPLINHVAAVLRRALVETKVSCYSDRAHLGLARYLQVVIERSSQSAQVVLVANASSAEPLAACFASLRERLGRDLHSLWFNANREPTNTILGPQFMQISGPDSVVEHFGGAAVHYPPGAFGQSNLEVAGRIIEHLRDEIPNGARVAEFYAGVGAIGLSILQRTAALRLNELSPHSLHGLSQGLNGLEATERAKVEVVPGSAGSACAMAEGVDVVIADPPRKGLDAELTHALAESPPVRLLYVSCGLDAFIADTARLTASGKLRLTGLTAFNLLPYTEHVETVGRFERA
jgi:tRNA/tmRNA/rRNA uracil-C5-methylase (TrmA/RlmC/RlmD family)